MKTGDAICLENIGQYLRKERESRHISLEEFSRRIRMGSYFIKALEENNYAFFSKPESLLWFLKRYARQLGIDSEDVTRRSAIQYRLKLRKESSGEESPVDRCFYLNSSNESKLIMSDDEKSGKESSTILSQKNKDTIQEKLEPRGSLEELKSLLGEEILPETSTN